MRNKHKRIITAHELCYLLSTRGRTEKTFKNGQRDHVNQNGCPTTVGTMSFECKLLKAGSVKNRQGHVLRERNREICLFGDERASVWAIKKL